MRRYSRMGQHRKVIGCIFWCIQWSDGLNEKVLRKTLPTMMTVGNPLTIEKRLH
ncbi:hypothetical protein BDR07DRAFT_1431104 [Suillus spraguei]|nr:hypothetical protein BDR07DRAFT_1431104 [Suillus spraguei]